VIAFVTPAAQPMTATVMLTLSLPIALGKFWCRFLMQGLSEVGCSGYIVVVLFVCYMGVQNQSCPNTARLHTAHIMLYYIVINHGCVRIMDINYLLWV